MARRLRKQRRIRSCLNEDAKKNIFHKDKRSRLDEKDKFRRSKTWKEFREEVAKNFYNIDPITLKKLVKGYNVHHLDMAKESYCNIDNKEKFVPLNSMTHKAIHWLFRYWMKDKQIIARIEEMLKKMESLNLNSCQIDEEKDGI